MTLQSTVSPDGKTVTIRIQGRFDFNLHKEFRDAYSGEAAGASHYVIDFKDTEYMDSSRTRRRQSRSGAPHQRQPGAAQDPRDLQFPPPVQDGLRRWKRRPCPGAAKRSSTCRR